MPEARIIVADVLGGLASLEDESVQCVITSPPYWGLRDYGVEGQIGLEKTPEEYTAKMVEVFREVRRVLRGDGVCFLNLGDSYAGSWGAQSRPDGKPMPLPDGGDMLSARQIQAHPRGTHTGSTKNTPGLKPKDLVGIPWRVAFALQADGWWLRSDIIWAKPNPMPESVTDRPTKAHEYIFLLTKSARYFWDQEGAREEATINPKWNYGSENSRRAITQDDQVDGDWKTPRRCTGEGWTGFAPSGPGTSRNIRSVWNIATHPFPGAHFAVFPPLLVEPMVNAGSREGDAVLDPFAGSGTTGLVACKLGRDFIGIELNPEYAEMTRKRIANDAPLFNEVTIESF